MYLLSQWKMKVPMWKYGLSVPLQLHDDEDSLQNDLEEVFNYM